MGLTLAKLRELAQSTLPSLREGSRLAGPQQQSRPGGQVAQCSPRLFAPPGLRLFLPEAVACQEFAPPADWGRAGGVELAN